MWKKCLAAGAVFGAALAQSGEAQSAWYARQHVSGCSNLYSRLGHVRIGSASSGSNHGAKSDPGTTDAQIACPIPAMFWSQIPYLTYAHLYTRVKSSSQPTRAKACILKFQSLAGTCSPTQSTSGSGHKSINLTPVKDYWYGDGVGYTHITFGSESEIYGIIYGENW